MNQEVWRRKKASLLCFKRIGFRQEWKCKTCLDPLEPTAQVDHVTPLWKGGSNADDNLQILCVRCHAEKTQHENTYRADVRYKTSSDYFLIFRLSRIGLGHDEQPRRRHRIQKDPLPPLNLHRLSQKN